MELSDLKPNPKNPRKITDKKLKALKKALEEFGDLGGIVYNRRMNRFIGGHQRFKVFTDCTKGISLVIDRRYSPPTSIGTVAEGSIDINGERFSYREVDWPEDKEMAANIAANKGAGEWDNDNLREMLLQLDAANFDLGLTMFDNHEVELALGLKEDKKKDKEKSGKKREVVCPECDCHFEAN